MRLTRPTGKHTPLHALLFTQKASYVYVVSETSNPKSCFKRWWSLKDPVSYTLQQIHQFCLSNKTQSESQHHHPLPLPLLNWPTWPKQLLLALYEEQRPVMPPAPCRLAFSVMLFSLSPSQHHSTALRKLVPLTERTVYHLKHSLSQKPRSWPSDTPEG